MSTSASGGFVPAGKVVFAERAPAPKALRPPLQPRHLRGLRYQHAVEDVLCVWAQQSGFRLESGPWLQFVNALGSAWRLCQPDVIVDPGGDAPLIVFEIKVAFSPLAWSQLNLLYRPVVERATGRRVRLAAICKSFDPAVAANCGGQIALVAHKPGAWLDHLVKSDAGIAGLPVLLWKSPKLVDIGEDEWPW